MKEFIFSMFGRPLTGAALDEATETDIQNGLTEGSIRKDEITEARAWLRKANRHCMPILIATDTREETEEVARERFILKEWNGVAKEHRWAYEASKDLYFTHVALFEGPKIDGIETDPYYFAGQKIEGPFSICAFDERTGKYRNFHCVNCCVTIRQQIADMQQSWALGVTHAAPQRLQ